jgi:uncharacterized protein YyaL (SSP411 family)
LAKSEFSQSINAQLNFHYFRVMNHIPFIPLLVILIFIGCTEKKENKLDHNGNHLIHESSPYLLQHAYNPVDWYPWGQEALEKAQKENKLILISIGYAACHWCHVMEHESFEDSTIAAQMNTSFVNIKVDREERPDIDDIYMTACQMSNGRGCGWPLNCFALPDGRPVWAGTYFPKEDWSRILNYFDSLYQADPGTLRELAQKITDGIKTMDEISPVSSEMEFDLDAVSALGQALDQRMDNELGGRTGAPKFPMPNSLMFLLRSDQVTGKKPSESNAIVTLDQMAAGGIYDHIGGGFSRYSVDEKWLVPHFEKMLYDNGQLLSAYSEAYKWTKKPRYAEVIRETIAFMQRELMSEQGGFYSSLDADSEGEEGKFYVWTRSEIERALEGKDAQRFIDHYQVSDKGNWEEEKNILHTRVDANLRDSTLKDMCKSLMSERSKRIRPGLDDKILCSWNALALKGLIDAFEALGDQGILDQALQTAEFIRSTFIQDDGRLDRNYKDGKTAINAFLDDYGLLAEAYIALYEVTFEQDWLDLAHGLITYAQAHFSDEASGMFFYTSDLDPALIARKKELSDNVIPGSNSVMARVLYKMGILKDERAFQIQAKSMLAAMLDRHIDQDQIAFHANWATLLYEVASVPYEIAIVGSDAANMANQMQTNFLPQAYYLGGQNEGSLSLLEGKLQEGRTMIYVCQNRVCKFPVDNVPAALKLMK